MRNRKFTLQPSSRSPPPQRCWLGPMYSLAAGDAAAAKQAFTTTCGACHSTEPGVNKLGAVTGKRYEECPSTSQL
jgi:mono/diheme cytochrome c family protein